MSNIKHGPYPLPQGYRWGSRVNYEDGQAVTVTVQLRKKVLGGFVTTVVSETQVPLSPAKFPDIGLQGNRFDTNETVENIQLAQRMLAEFSTAE